MSNLPPPYVGEIYKDSETDTLMVTTSVIKIDDERWQTTAKKVLSQGKVTLKMDELEARIKAIEDFLGISETYAQ
jgi:hypothetical protein